MRAIQLVNCAHLNSSAQFIREVRLTAREVRAPQDQAYDSVGVRMTGHKVRAPQFVTRMTGHKVRAPQFRVRMAAYEVRAPRLPARNSFVRRA